MGRHEEWEYRSGRFCSFHRSGARLEFARTGSKVHYAPDTSVQLKHVHLDLEVSPTQGRLSGRVTNTLKLLSAQKAIRLDAVGLQVESVEIQGSFAEKSVPFDLVDQSLWIRPKTALKAGMEIKVSVTYSVVRPKRGLYFTGPTRDYPKKPIQVWTQGEDEDNRYWFPSLDHPSQRATLESKIRVPKGWLALSNGALVSRKTLEALDEYQYRLDSPVVVYLTTLVVGEFEGWTDAGPRGLPVEYFVEKGRKDEGVRSFKHTPKMIEVFESKTGVKYPFAKYAQIAVQDFIFGGMENASATTQTDQTLHDARAALDFSSDPLVAHELAHQWFGDLVTCRDWAHAWLNEGFATFMERVWVESDPTSNGGPDEAKYYGYLDWREYVADDQGSYRRPVVCSRYREPQDLFDTHLYQKGGLVLNLLRSELGEADFWLAIGHYLKTSAGQSVETHDLIRAIETVTGRNLRQFFDQWIFGEGYPELEMTTAWDGAKKELSLKITQKQDKPFAFGLVVEAFGAEGVIKSERMELSESQHESRWVLDAAPQFVRVDPGFAVPKQLKFKRSDEMLVAQMSQDPDCMGRIDAAINLLDGGGPEGCEKVCLAFKSEAFWAVQAEMAQALGKHGSPAALEALVSCLPKATHPKARRAVVKALRGFRDARVSAVLKPIASADASYFVEAEAIQGWARSVSRSLPAEEIVAFLAPKLEVTSYRDVIRKAALVALAELEGLNRADCDPPTARARDLLLKWTRPPHPMEARVGAIVALGGVLGRAGSAVSTVILEAFSAAVNEGDYRLHGAVIAALGTAQSEDGLGLLSRIRTAGITTRLEAGAEYAMKSLEQKRGSTERLDDLKKQLDELKLETLGLKERVR